MNQTYQPTAVSLDERRPDESQAFKATISAFMGFFVDMFDVFLPVIALAPAMVYFRPKDMSTELDVLFASLILAATLIGRPLGSVIFGYLSDRVGRHPITILSIVGFGTCTLLIAILPGQETLGVWAMVLLVVLRLIGGVFLGGEYTAANVLAMEAAPKRKRGLYSGIIQCGYPVAYLCIAALTLLMLYWFPANGTIDSPYVRYGWRISFLIGGLIAFLVVIPYRWNVEESKLWIEEKTEEAGQKRHNPIVAVFTGQNLKRFGQVFLVLSGAWFLTVAAAAGMLPQILLKVVGLTSKQMSLSIVVASFFLIFGYMAAAAFSQYIGRRAMIILWAVISAVVGVYAYYMLLHGHSNTYGEIILYVTLIIVSFTSVFGVLVVYPNEIFPTNVRSSGFGMVFSIPVIIPSLYGVYVDLLRGVISPNAMPFIFAGIGCVLMVVGAVIGPETKDVELDEIV